MEKTISYIFIGIGLFSAGFLLGDLGTKGILASLFFVLCSLVIFGLENIKGGGNIKLNK